ncbi:MAG: class I SAM-dependent methyltransferase [Arenimonas sp.]
MAKGQHLPFPPGHFYSPIVEPNEVARRSDAVWPAQPVVAGIDFDPAGHAHLLDDVFPPLLRDYTYADTLPERDDLREFYSRNSQFGWLDSRAAFALLRHWQPRRVIEVGSGFSSLLIDDVGRRFLGPDFRLTCIEPFPRPFLRRLAGAELLVAQVQDVDLALFDRLGPGDVLFIDSSHVAKTGSDVNRLYFDVLPRLPRGVRVHVHDIFLPHEYPREWVLQENRSWNEQYLVRALLMDSTRLRVRFGCNYAWATFPDKVAHALALPPGQGFGGGSLWLEVV